MSGSSGTTPTQNSAGGAQDALRYAMLEYMNSLVMNSTKLSEESKESMVGTSIALFLHNLPFCPRRSWMCCGQRWLLGSLSPLRSTDPAQLVSFLQGSRVEWKECWD